MDGTPIRLGYAFGGLAVEHDHSVRSALYLMAHTDWSRYEITPLYITEEGRPARPGELAAKLHHIFSPGQPAVFAEDDEVADDFEDWVLQLAVEGETVDSIERLSEGDLDIVFPVFHGQGGEDGIIQGVLELFGVPYVGCGITGSTVGNDKEMNKRIVANRGIRTAQALSWERTEWYDDLAESVATVEKTIGYPVFVKPPRLGSSMGVSKAYDRDQLTTAVVRVLELGDKVLVERPVNGKEYGVGLIGTSHPEAGAIVEFGQGPDFLDYDAKYGVDAVEDTIPANLSPSLRQTLIDDACVVYRALDLSGFARIDFFIEDDQVIYNETNTVPGFGRTSVFSRLWAAAGVSPRQLVERLVKYGFERAEAKHRLRYNQNCIKEQQ